MLMNKEENHEALEKFSAQLDIEGLIFGKMRAFVLCATRRRWSACAF